MTKGAILIVTTWILMILTLFAIGVGFRTGLEIKLTGYNLDRMKALYIAKAGAKKAIFEKWREYAENRSLDIDAFSESWANNEEYFKDVKVGDGSFTLCYLSPEKSRSNREITLYGLEDESGKIDVNSSKSIEVLKNLLLDFGLELTNAEEIVASIQDWRDEDDLATGAEGISAGAEDSYYQTLETSYATSGRDFIALEELLLVKGITEGLFYGEDKDKDGKIGEYEKGIGSYLTIYGDGSININTASKEVLNAAFGIGYPDLAQKISDYRKGVDGRAGTDDDRWFAKGASVIDRGEKGMVEVKDLNDEKWYGNIFGIDEREYKRIRDLLERGALSATSDYYRANVVATVNGVKKTVTVVVKFNKPSVVSGKGFGDEAEPPDIEYLYWHEAR